MEISFTAIGLSAITKMTSISPNSAVSSIMTGAGVPPLMVTVSPILFRRICLMDTAVSY
jgi:hypothetical protein